MKILIFTFILLVFVTGSHGQAFLKCKLDEQTLMGDAMQCMMHEPELMMTMVGHMKNPSSMETSQFVCSHQSAMADLVDCMIKKVEDCLDDEVKKIVDVIMPKKEAWAAGIKFACENQKALSSTCMEVHMQEFFQCVSGNAAKIGSSLENPLISKAAARKAVCSVVNVEEGCVAHFKGSCSDEYIKAFDGMLETIIPGCPKTDPIKLDKTNSLFGDMLVHGQPLRFKPNQGPKYKLYGGI